MSEAEASTCSTCGAPLTINEGEIQVKCEFCGNVMVVPERFRQRQAQPVIQLATPVIQIDASQYVDPLYTYSRRRLRGLGCYLTVLILFIVGLTTLPILITSAALKPLIDGIFNQVPALQNIAPGVAGYASETMAFGGDGTGPGLFQNPHNIALDGSGNIYVSDYDTGRIQRFDANGKFLNTWTLDGKKPIIASMVADRSGNVYIVRDFAFPTAAIQKFRGASGELVGTFTGDKQDDFESLSVLADGNLLAFSHRVGSDDLVKLSPDGKVLSRVSKVISSQVDGSSMLSVALGVDGLGNTFVLSPYDFVVFKFSASGKFLNRFGRQGDNRGDFRSIPDGIAVDAKSRVYVLDFGKVLIFDADGRYVDQFATPGSTTYDIAFNDKNELFLLSGSKVHKMKLKNP
jgi:predicted RNA-binding Zn-ribbon protein involved in translation (DUF1610 family)